MIPVLTAEAMREADRRTIDDIGIPQCVLMERAALAAYGVLEEDTELKGKSILIICGPGNNGGDGAALARILSERDIFPEVVVLGDSDKRSEGLKDQLKLLKKIYPQTEIRETLPDAVYDIIVDAVFGISLNRGITGIYADAVAFINKARSLGAYVLALDIATGIDAGTGQIQEDRTVSAHRTVAFGAFKAGHLLFPGAMYSGTP